MKPCHTCGALLAASLADAVNGPGAEETCPKSAKTRADVKLMDFGPPIERNTLAALMMLGRSRLTELNASA